MRLHPVDTGIIPNADNPFLHIQPSPRRHGDYPSLTAQEEALRNFTP